MKTNFYLSCLPLSALIAGMLITVALPVKADVAKLVMTAPSDGVAIPRINYRQRTLPNGLSVYSIENHKSPTVAIQVWYKVGGKNDPEGKSGFAHLFEHIMFKSTRNMKAETMDRLTEDVGGENNAYTAEDRTVYHETVPSNYLETLLWAEADRMANLTVDQANFLSERAVVEEEFRQSILAPPYGRLNEYVVAHSFTEHPYKRGVIGSIPNLDTATVEDVQRFHGTFYRPDNAVLVVSGDFDPAKLDAWVDKYFGQIPKPEGEVPHVTVQEPTRTETKRYNETGPNVPLPAVVLDYLTPGVASADAEPLRVIEVIMGRGESSRLFQSLVYKQQIAAQAGASADLRADAGLFEFTTIAAGGKSLDDAEKATQEEIERLKESPILPSELEKARNQLLSDALQERETADGQAAALGYAVVMLGDPERINTDIARLQAVTADDVQRVAKQYFTPENLVIVRYTNGNQEQGGISTAPTKVATAVPAPFTPTEKPPKPSAPRQAVFPRPVAKTLPNGVRVIVVRRPGTGLVSVTAAVKAGGASDPNSAAGLADFSASLLARGTRTRTATQIAEAVEALGGSIGSGAGWDSTTVNLSVLSSQLVPAFGVFADVVKSPAFRKDEVERLRSETLDNLNVDLRSPGTIARYTAVRVVFGDSAYGHTIAGTPESIQGLKREQIEAFYRGYFQPRNTVLVFGGDILPEVAFSLADKVFGNWKAPGVTTASASSVVSHSKGGRVVVVDKSDAGQAAVVLARPGIRRADPHYIVSQVANSVLGGGYSSRLNLEIRIKRGLSYGAGSAMDARRRGGYFVATAQTRNDAVPEVVSLMQAELTRLTTTLVPPSELVPRKATLTGDYARELETGAGLAGEVARLAIYDLPLSTLSTYLPQVQAVTAAQIKAFAARELKPTEASIIVVGDGRKFLPVLRKKYPNTEVIPASKLDLNMGSLRKP
jgi:zinc protease